MDADGKPESRQVRDELMVKFEFRIISELASFLMK